MLYYVLMKRFNFHTRDTAESGVQMYIWGGLMVYGNKI